MKTSVVIVPNVWRVPMATFIWGEGFAYPLRRYLPLVTSAQARKSMFMGGLLQSDIEFWPKPKNNNARRYNIALFTERRHDLTATSHHSPSRHLILLKCVARITGWRRSLGNGADWHGANPYTQSYLRRLGS
jgi:hypothetical protein